MNMKKKHSDKKKDIQIVTTSGFPNRLGWLIHLVIWSIVFLFPFFFSNRDSHTITWPDYLRFFLNVIGIVVAFYANYSFLIKRFLFTKQTWQYILSNFLLFTSLAFVTHFLMEQIPPPENHHRGPRPEFSIFWFFMIDYIKYIFVAGLSVALKMTARWYLVEAERKELERSRGEAELQNLKSQLNPHFLFNTLNNIYSLIAISQERAQEAVHELSRLLRYMLYDSSQPLISVEKDINFVRNYIELMRIRLPEHVDLTTDIALQNTDMQIAPLLFISLIENAFKHGVSNNKPSFIHLRITGDNKRINCIIENSYFPKNEQDKSGSGIGMVNLRKRLDLLYPNTHLLICEHADDVFRSELTIVLSGRLR